MWSLLLALPSWWDCKQLSSILLHHLKKNYCFGGIVKNFYSWERIQTLVDSYVRLTKYIQATPKSISHCLPVVEI